MLFFIVFLTIFGIVIWKYLPETKNKSFEEIAKILGIPSIDDNENEDEIPLVSIVNSKRVLRDNCTVISLSTMQ